MFRIIDDRSSGKTSRLMLLAKENNAVILCANPEALRKKAYDYGIVGVDFAYYDAIGMLQNTNIMIDEMENFVKYLAFEGRNKLLGYTMSKEG